MKEALLVIDVQNDFLPGGSLAVPQGDEIIPVLNELIPQFELVVASQDFHPKGHHSFASTHSKSVGEVIDLNGNEQILWPDHCVQTTNGVQFSPLICSNLFDEVVQKGVNMEVDSYSAFFDNNQDRGTNLDKILKKKGVNHIHVVGLATDYCVKFSVLDGLKLGYDVTLILDGCRAVNLNPKDEEEAIEEMKKNGAKVMLKPGLYG